MTKAIHLRGAGKLAWSFELIRALGLAAACCVDAFAQTGNGASSAATHCAASERVVFSCPFKNGKTVSLCASSDLSKDSGTLQYRFGRVGHKLELSYPTTATHPRESFSFYPGEPYGEPGRQWFYGPSRILAFKVSRYRYSIEVFKNKGTGEFYGAIFVAQKNNMKGGKNDPLLVEDFCALELAVDNFDELTELGIPFRY